MVKWIDQRGTRGRVGWSDGRVAEVVRSRDPLDKSGGCFLMRQVT
jgi:hypothetical protein